jgi:hypothetical protein
MSFAARISLLLALGVAAVPALAAGEPTLLGSSKAWTAYQAAAPEGKVCYALSKPTETSPKKLARDPVFFLISTWPSRKVADEVQVVPGYPYKDGEAVTAQVGNQKTEFFSRNDGKSGSAWVKELADEAALIKAMRGGTTLKVTGVSKKGTKTIDTYSLIGLGTALDRIHKECRR